MIQTESSSIKETLPSYTNNMLYTSPIATDPPTLCLLIQLDPNTSCVGKCEVRSEFGIGIIPLRFIRVLKRLELLQNLNHRETRLGQGVLFCFLSQLSIM